MVWILDLDGVVWLAGKAIPGSPEAIDRLRDAGERVVFVTNNSGPTLEEYVGMLGHVGVEVKSDDLVTSAQAAASLLSPGSPVAMVGGEGLNEALRGRGLRLVDASASPEAVVVGRSLALDYNELARAASAIRDGARFIATNTDATFPTGNGLVPGAGALVAFLEVASGRKAEVAGKPDPPAAALVRERFGAPSLVVGDRPDTDGAFAVAMGAPFGLVLSGVTKQRDLPVTPEPSTVGANLAELVERMHPR
ncbi:MAG: HAD-IIA family hydrolase [Acidimicrobiaceae bacterium]|nr:HAD-IIA family hydrolase [Acidimicrobiaceae bacterium]